MVYRAAPKFINFSALKTNRKWSAASLLIYIAKRIFYYSKQKINHAAGALTKLYRLHFKQSRPFFTFNVHRMKVTFCIKRRLLFVSDVTCAALTWSVLVSESLNNLMT